MLVQAIRLVGASAAAWLIIAGGGARAVAQAPATPTSPPRWVRHHLVVENIRHVRVDTSGWVWVRMPGSGGGTSDLVLGIGPNGRPQVQGMLGNVIAKRADAIRRQGDLADFWAVDLDGRVWVGPSYFDGRSWTVVDRGGARELGTLRYDGRAAVDAKGLAWAPYIATPQCPGADPCDLRGLRAFDAKGLRDAITFEPMREADAYGVADVHLVPFSEASPQSPTRKSPLAAAARTGLYTLPDPKPLPYPFLGPPASPTDLRNAGYATAAARHPDGRLVVLTWVEIQTRDGAEARVFANPFTEGKGWGESEDWTLESPLVEGRAKGVRLVALAFAPDRGLGGEELWAASSAGEVGRRLDGAWGPHFTAGEIGLPAKARVRDVAVGADGTVWLATSDGLFSFGAIEPIGLPGRVALPLVVRR